jgi:hypothetical protein
MLFASARRSHDAWIWRPERRLGFHSDASRIPIVTTVKRNETTRLALMRAAERLFAERGVDPRAEFRLDLIASLMGLLSGSAGPGSPSTPPRG